MTVTVLSGPERRRRWTSAEKLRIVEESLAGETSVSEVVRRRDVHPNQLHAWRRQAHLGLLGSGVAAVARPACRFVPITVATDGGANDPPKKIVVDAPPVIEVVLRNGRLLRLPAGLAPAWVVALADALEGLGR